jgi:conjugative relaxase-like TrwC/TraI family protein
VLEAAMLRITPSVSPEGAKRYFGENMTRSDYYLDGQEVVGQWGGKTAERLGLAGQVDQQSYFALVDNINPRTGEPLTPRTKTARRVGFDFTFSAPKHVSVLYELSGDQRILDAFRESVNGTMQEIEREMKTRVRRNGADEDRITGNIVWAEFTHFTSRPVGGVPDPHLHSHLYCFNNTFCEKERRFKAGQFGDLKRDAPYWEAAFDARLAHRLNALGYVTEKDPKYSFRLMDLPVSITDKFSRRRNEIEAKAAAQGITDAEGKHAIGYYGREHKTLDQAKSELRREWASWLSPGERDALQKLMAGSGSTGGTMSAKDAMDYAIAHTFERVSTISEKRLKAEALRHGVGSVLPSEITAEVKRDEFVGRDVKGEHIVTTKQVLREEIGMLQFAHDGRGKFAPFGDGLDGLSGLTDEQRAAAQHVIRSRDRIVGIRGGAGTGKTHLMRGTIDGIEQGTLTPGSPHTKVFVFAPSAQAARGVLRGEGFANAETLERLLLDKRMQQETRGQVLWLDEAGLVSNRDMSRLFALAKENGNRVILSGDYKQHGSIDAGDSFRILESEAGVRFAELKTIRRQRDPAYRKAVEEISKGTAQGAEKGFDWLDAMGAIIEASGEERHTLLVADYLEAAREGKSALIIAPTHREGDRLTEELRRALKARGALGEERSFVTRDGTDWTQAQRQDARNYEAGMVVEFHQNVPGERKREKGQRITSGGFTRGECAVVTGKENGRVTLIRTNGQTASLPVENADRFQVFRTRELAIAEGDRIRLTQNGSLKTLVQMAPSLKGPTLRETPTRVSNGDTFTVEGFTRSGEIRLTGGKILPKTYGHFGLGYTDTSYASQGKTVDRVFIATGNESLRATNQQQWYVSVSRGRESARIYVDSKAEVREAIQRSAQRLSAVELTRHKESPAARTPSWGKRLYALLTEHNHVARFLRGRKAERRDRQQEKGGLSYV